MSHNQTNKIHNPFEGEELEKGRFNLNKAENQIGKAMAIINKQSKSLAGVVNELRKAQNMVEGSSNFIEVLAMSDLVAPKRARSTDDRDIRKIVKELRFVAKELQKLEDKVPFFEAMEYNTTLAIQLTELRAFNRKR
tara:strand:+ start:734 stop:1144 length:411 start_codon:yes stop_codon:yes gene_type:complete